MKKKLALALIACLSVNMIGCSEPTTQKTSSQISDADIQKMIDDSIQTNNENLKKSILDEFDTILDTELKNLKDISEMDQEEFKSSIMESVQQALASNTGSTTEIIKQPINEYYTTEENTYTTEEHITNVTEENTTTIVDKEEPPRIKDGTTIPCTTKLPFTVKIKKIGTFTINSLDIKAYNHKNEPYMESTKPYEIRISCMGSYELNDRNGMISAHGDPFILQLSPYDTQIPISISTTDKELSGDFSTSFIKVLNILPDTISIKDNKNSDFAFSGSTGGGNSSSGGNTGGNTSGGGAYAWISEDGYYHRSSYCDGYKMTDEVMMEHEAKEQGYLPCPDCKPN